jgi:hypothetical protein
MPRSHSTRRNRWDLAEFAAGPRTTLGAPVRAAATGALPGNALVGLDLVANAAGALPSIDGVSAAVGDRLLLKDEGGPENGVYTVADLGDGSRPWVLRRAEDADADEDWQAGLSFYVAEGVTHGKTVLSVTNIGAIVLGTTTISFSTLALYPRLRSVATQAGPSLTGNDAETVLQSVTIPAETLVKGSVIRVWCDVRVTVDAGTTELVVRLRLGGTTLTGTILIQTASVDTGTTFRAAGSAELVVRDDPGNAVELTGLAEYNDPAAAGAAVKRAYLDPTPFATDADLLVEVTGDWDNADANACQCEQMTVEVF